MQVCRMCLSHNIHHQNVSINDVIYIWVFYKNIGNRNYLWNV